MSKIEWTQKTWNPVIGCSMVSEGCKNCYAARMAFRLSFNPKMSRDYQGLTRKTSGGLIQWTGKINFRENKLLEPCERLIPTTYFVNSMSDLFHPDIAFDVIAKIFAVMSLCPQHTFQVLTKHPDRALEYFTWDADGAYSKETAEVIVCTEPHLFHRIEIIGKEPDKFPAIVSNELLPHLIAAGWHWASYAEGDKRLDTEGDWPLPNVWMGTSVENQAAAELRIPFLIEVPAAVRFLSCEPLLGPLDISDWFYPASFVGMEVSNYEETKFSNLQQSIHWVIVGGESGPGARPMHQDWPLSIRGQCRNAEIPFFFKQWGEYLPDAQATHEFYGNMSDADADNTYRLYPPAHMPGKKEGYYKLGKKKAGNKLDGVVHQAFPGPIFKPSL